MCFHPNLLITIFPRGIFPDTLRIILVEPDGTTRCRERVELFLIGEVGLDPELQPQRDALLARFESFNDGDGQ